MSIYSSNTSGATELKAILKALENLGKGETNNPLENVDEEGTLKAIDLVEHMLERISTFEINPYKTMDEIDGEGPMNGYACFFKFFGCLKVPGFAGFKVVKGLEDIPRESTTVLEGSAVDALERLSSTLDGMDEIDSYQAGSVLSILTSFVGQVVHSLAIESSRKTDEFQGLVDLQKEELRQKGIDMHWAKEELRKHAMRDALLVKIRRIQALLSPKPSLGRIHKQVEEQIERLRNEIAPKLDLTRTGVEQLDKVSVSNVELGDFHERLSDLRTDTNEIFGDLAKCIEELGNLNAPVGEVHEDFNDIRKIIDAKLAILTKEVEQLISKRSSGRLGIQPQSSPTTIASFSFEEPDLTAQDAAELEVVDAFVDELANLSLLEEQEEIARGWKLNSNAAPFEPAFIDAQEAAELEEVEHFVAEQAILSFLEEQEEEARTE